MIIQVVINLAGEPSVGKSGRANKRQNEEESFGSNHKKTGSNSFMPVKQNRQNCLLVVLPLVIYGAARPLK